MIDTTNNLFELFTYGPLFGTTFKLKFFGSFLLRNIIISLTFGNTSIFTLYSLKMMYNPVSKLRLRVVQGEEYHASPYHK